MSTQDVLAGTSLAPAFSGREIARWALAAAVVISVHAAGAWYAQRFRQEVVEPEAAPAAIMVELEPIAVAPDAVEEETIELTTSQASETIEEESEPQPEPVEPEPAVEPEPVDPILEEEIAEALEPEPVVEPEPQEEIPDLIEVPMPNVAMLAAPPKIEIEKPEPAEKPEEIEKPKPVEKPRPVKKQPKPKEKVEEAKKEKTKPSKSSVASRKSAQSADKTASAASGGAGKSVSPAKWNSKLNAHLRRYQRRSAKVRGGGLVHVGFKVNASGAVLSASVVRSSGNAAADRAAVDLVRRASPMPAPPPELPSSALYKVVPVDFK